MQLSKPFGTITVQHDIRTKGGEGDSLVRGKEVKLKAHALSLKPEAKGDEIIVKGQAIAENKAVSDYDFSAPSSVIGRIQIAGKPVT